MLRLSSGSFTRRNAERTSSAVGGGSSPVYGAAGVVAAFGVGDADALVCAAPLALMLTGAGERSAAPAGAMSSCWVMGPPWSTGKIHVGRREGKPSARTSLPLWHLQPRRCRAAQA